MDTVDLLCACYEGLGDGEAATRLMEESYAECRVGAGNIPYRTAAHSDCCVRGCWPVGRCLLLRLLETRYT